jgi:phage terminase large subunit GpA
LAVAPHKIPAKGHKTAPVDRATARAVQALSWPDVWAEDMKLQVDSHSFTMKGREYERAILRDEASRIYIPKGAQLGLTSTAIIKCIHCASERRKNVLYLLPLKSGSKMFVQARIDPIIESNKSLEHIFSRTNNVVQKQTIHGTNWYIRGTNIRTELREVPVDVLVLDERDVANEDNLPDAYERISGSSYARVIELSTPTVDGHGVYAEDAWYASDKNRWYVRCSYCNAAQVLTFEENVEPWLGEDPESSLCCCSHCHKPLSDDDRGDMNATGEWVPENASAAKRGYYVNQLNSPTKPLASMLQNYFLGQHDIKLLKSFHNNGLGLPFTAPGDKFTVELLDKARKSFTLGGFPEGPVFYGIDVQYEALYLTAWTRDGLTKRLRLWDTKVVTSSGGRSKWTVLDEDILPRTHNWIALIDAHPAKEEVEALCKKWGGRVWMAFEKDAPNQPETADWQNFRFGEVPKVNIDRTMAFDGYIKKYIDGLCELPRDARELGEHQPRLSYNGFYHQHLQMVRVEQARGSENTTGTAKSYSSEQIVARWVKNKVADHWHHSSMFGFVATLKDVPLDIPADVGEVLRAAGGFIGG